MIADDIARDIWRKESSAYMNQEEKPKLTVYMSIDMYHDMMMEISGSVSSAALEAAQKGSIHGCPIFKVVSALRRGDPTYHEPWRVL